MFSLIPCARDFYLSPSHINISKGCRLRPCPHTSPRHHLPAPRCGHHCQRRSDLVMLTTVTKCKYNYNQKLSHFLARPARGAGFGVTPTTMSLHHKQGHRRRPPGERMESADRLTGRPVTGSGSRRRSVAAKSATTPGRRLWSLIARAAGR